MKRIYVDFDDVLCETARVLAKVIAREFGKIIPYEEITSFDLTESFALNDAESQRLFDLFHDPNILLGITPIDGAAETLREWQATGHFIHIVTGRPPATCQASHDWLKAQDVPFSRMSFVDKYSRNHAPVEGVDTITLTELRKMDFDLAIDDSPTAIEFLVDNTDIPVIIFDRPWNRNILDPKDSQQIMRCASWTDVLDCTRSIL